MANRYKNQQSSPLCGQPVADINCLSKLTTWVRKLVERAASSPSPSPSLAPSRAASGAYLRREQLKACSALCTTHLKPLTPKRADPTLCKLVFCALVQNGLEKLKRKSTKKKRSWKQKLFMPHAQFVGAVNRCLPRCRAPPNDRTQPPTVHTQSCGTACACMQKSTLLP